MTWPRLKVDIDVQDNIIIVTVPEGTRKPYSCARGFYLRSGPNSQKLERDSIIEFFQSEAGCVTMKPKIITVRNSHPLIVQNTYPFKPLKNAEQMAKLIANDSGVQFSHGISEQIGGQLAAGLRLTNVFDDIDTDAAAGDYPSYWASRAVKE